MPTLTFGLDNRLILSIGKRNSVGQKAKPDAIETEVMNFLRFKAFKLI